MVKVIIDNDLKVIQGISTCIFTFDFAHSRGQGQARGHFDT